jgi:hypothetical protein
MPIGWPYVACWTKFERCPFRPPDESSQERQSGQKPTKEKLGHKDYCYRMLAAYYFPTLKVSLASKAYCIEDILKMIAH